MLRRTFLGLMIWVVSAAGQDCTQVLPVRVIDEDTGMPIEAFPANRLTARVGSSALPITALTRIRTGRLVVLIDESGSMTETPNSPFSYQGAALRAVKQTLVDLMSQLPRGISIQYGLFSDKWVFSDSFLSDSRELHKSIDEVTARFGKAPFGHTAIYDSLHEALKRFETPQPGDSILLLTDAGDNSSKLSAKKLEREFVTANVRLLPVIIHTESSRWEAEARIALHDIVEKTGGSSLEIHTESTSWVDNKTLPRNLEVIRQFWHDRVLATDVIHIQVPASLKKETKWTLSVNRDGDARLKHAGAIYPTRLRPCPVATAAVP